MLSDLLVLKTNFYVKLLEINRKVIIYRMIKSIFGESKNKMKKKTKEIFSLLHKIAGSQLSKTNISKH